MSRSFIVGTGKGYRLGDIANETMVASREEGLLPDEAELAPQLDALAEAIAREGHTVYRPPICPVVPDQTCPRDAGFSLGCDRIYMGRSGIATRVEEGLCLAPLVREAGLEPIHFDGMLDGGDLIHESLVLSPDDAENAILVGMNERSSPAGLSALESSLPSPSSCRLVRVSHTRLHLDCALTLARNEGGELLALTLSGSGLGRLPYRHKTFEDDGSMASNLLWLDSTRFVTRENALDSDLTRYLLDTCEKRAIALPFSALPQLGGSVRCATLPLSLGATPRPTRLSF